MEKLEKNLSKSAMGFSVLFQIVIISVCIQEWITFDLTQKFLMGLLSIVCVVVFYGYREILNEYKRRDNFSR